MKFICLLIFVCTSSMLFFAGNAYADSTFIRFGSSWRYVDDGRDQGTAWRESSSSTDSWVSGLAKFGYGNGDERTILKYSSNNAGKPITTYFSKTIDIQNKSQYVLFRLRSYVDDGMIVYVNGKQVFSTNMAAGVVSAGTPASAENPDDGNVALAFNVPAEKFSNGLNYIAVEVHQASSESDDLSFDLELKGITRINSPMLVRGPLLQMVSPDAITITWRTDEYTSSAIKFGTAENSLTATLKNDSLVKNHELRLTGLLPDTKYFYSVGTGADVLEGSYRNYFITSPPSNTTRKIRIGVFGDAGSGNLHQKRARNAYLRLFKQDVSAELALMLGDNAYNNGTDMEYQANFFNAYDDNIFNNHVVFPIPGNHEYHSPGTPYFSVFSLPKAAESGGVASGTESYYSFDYGNIHFIMLNSMGKDGGKLLSDSTGAQALWLKKDLAASAGKFKWTIACLHHPPYSNGTHNSDGEPDLTAIRQQITPILERFGVDAVLAGHSHVYERSFLIQGHTGTSNTFKTNLPASGNLVSGSSARYDGSVNSCPYFTIDTVAKKGTVYVVAGSAGQIGGGDNSAMPLFYYRNYSGTSGGESGILYLEVQDNRLDGKFMGASGIIKDQFTIMKGVNTKKVITSDANKPVELTASWVGSYNWIPAPAAGQDAKRTLTVTPSLTKRLTYYVKDSIGSSKTCISDTFEINPTITASFPYNFEARQKNTKILLTWSTAVQPGSDYFTVEKSLNGRDFEMLTIIKPGVSTNPNPSAPMSFEFEDNYAVPGRNFYRLTRNSGSTQTFKLGTRIVDFEAVKTFTYSLRPDAASRNLVTLNIQSFRKQLLQTSIFDMNGRQVYHSALPAQEGSNKLRIPLAAGLYVLHIVASDQSHISEKIVVN